jgi:hypothetical protein
VTLSTLTNRINYPGAGLAGPFAIPFRFFAAADLLLTRVAASGTETTLVYGADFTVTGIGDATGSATLTTVLAVGETISIRRAPALTQPTSIRNQGAYFPATIEDEFDRIAMQLQSLNDRLQRSFGAIESLDPTTLTLLVRPEAGKVLGWDTSTLLTNKTLDASATALPGGGRTTATLSAFLANNSVYNAKDWGARIDDATDDTAAVQATLDAAKNAKIAGVWIPDGKRCRILGTLTVWRGITLFGNASTGEYYEGFDGLGGSNFAFGATLYKPAAGTAGPIVSLEWAAGIRNITLNHQKLNGATTGILRMGTVGLTTDLTNCVVSAVNIIGRRTSDLTGANTCYGIYFPESQTGHARYFNSFNQYRVTECDVAVHLGGQANGNTFSNGQTRECHVHYELDGQTSLCIENTFTCLAMFAINSPDLAPDPVCFKLRNNARNNQFIGYSSESYGSTWDSDASSTGNRFLGFSNEITPSHPGTGNSDFNYARPTNPYQYNSMTFPTRTTGDRNIFGRGNKVSFFKDITGALPNANDATGTLTAAGANNKVIINLGGEFAKASLISFKAKLALWVYLPFNHSMHWVEVEFVYRNTNQSTSAGSLSVLSVKQKGADITGLYFLTGVAGGTGFEIALVLGNLGSATPPDVISCELDVTALTYSSNVITMDNIATQPSFVTRAVTANDVTNKISLLTVADTAI